jgi:two-component system, OmpR family, sensor kinase
MRVWPTSLRSRLTLWYTILLGVPVVVFACACYVVVARTLEQRTDVFIGDALTAFARELQAERRASMSVVEAMRTAVDEVRFRELHIAILDTASQVVAQNALADNEDDQGASRRPSPEVEERLLAVLRARRVTDALAVTVPSARGEFRLLARPLTVGGGRYTLTGAYSLQDIDSVLERVRAMFLIAIPLLLAAASFGGYSLARRSLEPVAAMSAQAAAITASTMHERLSVGGGDELVGLASGVNGLLDRLENAFDQQRRFVTDASHELRTPTAVVRAEADITLSREHRGEGEYRESVRVIQDAASRLTRIVDDLFLLSRADSGHLVLRRSPLYLEDVVHDATRAVTSVAHQRGVEIEVRDLAESPFEGDPDLLGRLLLNLLDNAIKYSPSGSTVDVALQRRNGQYEIRVGDAGPGIPTDLQDRVFERFYRIDTARSRAEASATSGAGLGLAIARRIAIVHDGTVSIAGSRAGRTEFLVTLPVTTRGG